MRATIWHNPACGTSRKTLEILQQSGAEVTVVDYLTTPYERSKLEQLLRDARLTPKDALRLRGTDDSIYRAPANRARRKQLDSLFQGKPFKGGGALCDSLHAIADREDPIAPVADSA